MDAADEYPADRPTGRAETVGEGLARGNDTHGSEQCFLVLFGLCFVRCSGAVRFQPFGGGFLFGGFVRTIGSVREFCSAVLFLFGRSLENVFVL